MDLFRIQLYYADLVPFYVRIALHCPHPSTHYPAQRIGSQENLISAPSNAELDAEPRRVEILFKWKSRT